MSKTRALIPTEYDVLIVLRLTQTSKGTWTFFDDLRYEWSAQSLETLQFVERNRSQSTSSQQRNLWKITEAGREFLNGSK